MRGGFYDPDELKLSSEPIAQLYVNNGFEDDWQERQDALDREARNWPARFHTFGYDVAEARPWGASSPHAGPASPLVGPASGTN